MKVQKCNHGTPNCPGMVSGATGVCGPCTNSWSPSGVTGIHGAGHNTSRTLMRSVFCDQHKHRIYKAIGERCPCFEKLSYGDGGSVGNHRLKGAESIITHNGVVYFVDPEGLALRVSELFGALKEQSDE